MKFEAISNYINTNFKTTTTYEESLQSLIKISDFLEKLSTSEVLLIDLILNSKVLDDLLKKVVYNNIQLVKTGNFSVETNNRIVLSLVEIYCMINSIHIESEEDIVHFKNNGEEVNIVNQYLKEIGSWPLLTEEEEKNLALRVKNNDQQAKKEFIERNLRLVIAIAKRYTNRGLSFSDLIQEGNFGLMMAVDRYDLNKGYKFSTFATHWIKHTITRAITNYGRNIRIPAHLYAEVGTFIRTKNSLEITLHRKPTLDEIAKVMGISFKYARRLEKVLSDTVSINTPVNEQEDNELGDFIPSTIYETEPIALENSMKEEVYQLLQKCGLSQREIDIVKLRYGLGTDETKTLQEISKMYGITRERIRQLEEKALIKLRNSIYIKEFACYMDSPKKAVEAIDEYRLEFRNKRLKKA